jgi:hypothetical protein
MSSSEPGSGYQQLLANDQKPGCPSPAPLSEQLTDMSHAQPPGTAHLNWVLACEKASPAHFAILQEAKPGSIVASPQVTLAYRVRKMTPAEECGSAACLYTLLCMPWICCDHGLVQDLLLLDSRTGVVHDSWQGNISQKCKTCLVGPPSWYPWQGRAFRLLKEILQADKDGLITMQNAVAIVVGDHRFMELKWNLALHDVTKFMA